MKFRISTPQSKGENYRKSLLLKKKQKRKIPELRVRYWVLELIVYRATTCLWEQRNKPPPAWSSSSRFVWWYRVSRDFARTVLSSLQRRFHSAFLCHRRRIVQPHLKYHQIHWIALSKLCRFPAEPCRTRYTPGLPTHRIRRILFLRRICTARCWSSPRHQASEASKRTP